jgi:ABC-2 type transport system ATP-binding protein
MPLIEIKNLTKDYGEGRGIFDLSLSIEKGEVYGFAGTNGAGKTTTIRHLMGFLKPQNGSAAINGLNCWERPAEIMKTVGYVPGEIAFPAAATGMDFLKNQAELLGLRDMSCAGEIIAKLQLDPTADLKRMSKGMKQKTAIVAAFMADPDVLILDEPTTGLDPLMRAQFIDMLKAEKRKGKTIFMSSHMFEELEDVCDKVALIKNGKIIAVTSVREIRHHQNKVYKIEFASHDDYSRFSSKDFAFAEKREDRNQVVVIVNDMDINAFTKALTGYKLKFITENKFTLEEYFKSLFSGGKTYV